MALVPQRPHLFYGSVLENIRLARPDASRSEVERAAELAGARFIRRMPHGYDTQIGERGQRLSGGEAQRLAIARAFLKDAPLLVMDEPTSSLDPESERLIRDALEPGARPDLPDRRPPPEHRPHRGESSSCTKAGRRPEPTQDCSNARALLASGGRLRGRAGVRCFCACSVS